jgi:aromatase
MSEQGFSEAGHEITVHAPADDVYRLIADVENWPLMFPPTIHVDQVERGERDERIRICAIANGQAKQWTSYRELDPDARRIDFRQEVSAPPVAAMGGSWIISRAGEGTSRVLPHYYRAVDDDADSLRWIEAAVDRNSRSELAALKAHAESAAGGSELQAWSGSSPDTVPSGRAWGGNYSPRRRSRRCSTSLSRSSPRRSVSLRGRRSATRISWTSPGRRP